MSASTKKSGGRPTKLTPEVQDKITSALRAGNYLETAAAFAGLHRDTLYAWLRRGARASKGPYYDFSQAVAKALADWEVRDVTLVGKAATDGDWQAAAWRLERRQPERWGRRQKHEVDANVKTTVKVNADDAVQELARLLAPRPARGGTDRDS